MRWFVEISSLGPSPADKATVCVEAPQWQPALQKARALRGDDGAPCFLLVEERMLFTVLGRAAIANASHPIEWIAPAEGFIHRPRAASRADAAGAPAYRR